MTQPAVLSVKNLKVAFGRKQVVHDLSFDIAPGSTLAVVGESGSGKSVTSLAIMGLLPDGVAKASGSIKLDGRELLSLTETEMCGIRGGKISMIFQEPMTSLNPVQKVGVQIGEVISIHRGLRGKELRNAVLEMLRKVGIPDPERRINNYPHTFSGGMRQRVMIAMALACNPSVIIADEPTTALDVTVQAQILELLKELQRETNVALLFITHDMGVVAEIADRVLVMRAGQVVESGSVETVFTEPESPYTRVLIEAAPSVAGKLIAIDQPTSKIDGLPLSYDGGGPVLEVRDLSVRFPLRGGLLGTVQGNVHAVEKVSFAIGKGETLGLVGESGSGKSTIGKAIIDLAPRHGGTIVVDGRTVDYSEHASLAALRRDVQMIFQDPFGSLDSRQTVGSAIMEPMHVHGIASGPALREKMEWLLQKVGLDPARASSLPHEFSGGQRQRICIARALAMSPKLIIADEAVSALDVAIKGQIIDLMMDLQSDFGISYLFISHDMAAIEKICNRVAVMYFGELVEIGSRDDVIGRPGHSYTKRLLSAVPITHPSQRSKRTVATPQSQPPASPIKPLGFTPDGQQWAAVDERHFVRV
ncbi:ABC transporter ATP-binding protein (plasmid) [Agrobacterium tumefaciens]|uniref:Glutathione import ATP-binding protein GsiA n=1 Tax=Agrobacterium tumefaciens TaxID=358 RepID=A0A2Z2PK83_AGRTU|nr:MULTISPECIES: ABC transporter ATP-binding protein [Rhizobium/Agrobacterium group]ASK41189.1 ABC transporter ATP-binding protein [Agrobacterium tumefaciens]ASK41824.1 ABC transporter ATP-binding protein [Agrobacterium tumefaciens]MDJ1637403.1 ABC transporter ATP-binding protein [Rhizobium rhizogenes]MDR5010975.1 ABC transporter ATP-binding protein [Agrobacterium tumefaciens]NSZ87738.1 ABC transporter ATP-binding protein [Agrobacterium tumefaciens]